MRAKARCLPLLFLVAAVGCATLPSAPPAVKAESAGPVDPEAAAGKRASGELDADPLGFAEEWATFQAAFGPWMAADAEFEKAARDAAETGGHIYADLPTYLPLLASDEELDLSEQDIVHAVNELTLEYAKAREVVRVLAERQAKLDYSWSNDTKQAIRDAREIHAKIAATWEASGHQIPEALSAEKRAADEKVDEQIVQEAKVLQEMSLPILANLEAWIDLEASDERDPSEQQTCDEYRTALSTFLKRSEVMTALIHRHDALGPPRSRDAQKAMKAVEEIQRKILGASLAILALRYG